MEEISFVSFHYPSKPPCSYPAQKSQTCLRSRAPLHSLMRGPCSFPALAHNASSHKRGHFSSKLYSLKVPILSSAVAAAATRLSFDDGGDFPLSAPPFLPSLSNKADCLSRSVQSKCARTAGYPILAKGKRHWIVKPKSYQFGSLQRPRQATAEKFSRNLCHIL